MDRRNFGIHFFGWQTAIVAWLALVQWAPAEGAEPARKAKMLMLTQSAGFKHGSVTRKEDQLSPAEIAMTHLGESSGLFTVHCTQDAAADFTKENLQKYDIVFFYTTGDLPIKDSDLDYFFNVWLKQKGHGFIGAHSASDTYHNNEAYWDMIGGTFDGHPWNSKDTVTISVHDTKHPGSKPFGEEFQIKDEIYQYKHWQPNKVHVLMSLNMAKCGTKKPYQVPVSWVKEYGDGKVYYTNLGHNPETWTNKTFLQAMEGGVKWIQGLEQGDAKPNPDVSKAQEEKAKSDTEAAAK